MELDSLNCLLESGYRLIIGVGKVKSLSQGSYGEAGKAALNPG